MAKRMKRPTIRFRVVDRDVLERAYPRELASYESDFGHPSTWSAAHWETVALDRIYVVRVYKSNRRSLLKKLKSFGVSPDKIDAAFQRGMKQANAKRATIAGNASHKADREAKEAGLAIYAQKKWPSDAEAARKIATIVRRSSVTVLHWIQNLPKDKKRIT